MTRFRVVTNGHYYRIQRKKWLRWRYVMGAIGGTEPWLTDNRDSAFSYADTLRELERKKVGWWPISQPSAEGDL